MCSSDLEGMQLLFDYDWPGNVRQLANLLERAAIMSSGEVLTAAEIGRALDGAARLPVAAASPEGLFPPAGNLRDTLQDMERNMLLAALRKAGGVQKDAARSLGVSPKNLWNKLQKHRIDPSEYAG